MLEKKTSLIIVGCGFLGKAAASLFCSQGYSVLGIVRTPLEPIFHTDHNEEVVKASAVMRVMNSHDIGADTDYPRKTSCSTQHPSGFTVSTSDEHQTSGLVKHSPTEKSYSLLSCDVTDPLAVDALTKNIPPESLLIYCVSSGKGGSDTYAAIYRDGLERLLHSWKPKRALFVSSTSVYGQKDGEIVTESSSAEPDRETGRILLEAEKIALQSGGVVARLSGIYGPGRSMLLRKFLEGTATLENGGGRLINQIHRDDAASALFCLMTHENASGIYNVTDDTPASQREVYAWISEALQKPLPPPGPADLNRKRGWTSKQISNEKLHTLGWAPQFPSYREALPELIEEILLKRED